VGLRNDNAFVAMGSGLSGEDRPMHVARERRPDFTRQDFGRNPFGEPSVRSLAAATAAVAAIAIALIVLIPRPDAASAQADATAQSAFAP
jgi:hypothetical protein